MTVSGELVGQTSFGTDMLFTDARENVAHRFIAMDSGNTCVALFNRGVYGSHYENNTLYMSLVRGVTYCAQPIRERELIPSGRFTKKIDQGENNYSFRLTVTNRDQLERKAMEFSQKSYALNIFPIPTTKVEPESLDVSLGGNVISMPTVKKAYGKDAVIFRLLNNTPKTVDSYIKVNGQCLPLNFGKYEVKTVVYENGTLKETYELLV
jgi:alpha-mannosidase